MGDRRKLARKSTNDYFLVHNDETNELIGRVMDINADGAMLISEEPIPVPRTFKCRLRLPRMIGRYRFLHFELECKWCNKNKRLGWFEAGFQMREISMETLAVIEELTNDWDIKDGLPSPTAAAEGNE
jgi:hypothetical protein